MSRVYGIVWVSLLIGCAAPTVPVVAPVTTPTRTASVPTLAPGVTQALGTTGKLVTSFALDATHIYWTTCYYADGVNAIGKVAKLPKAGGAETILAADQPCPRNLSIDATSAYWVNRGPETPSNPYADGAVMRVDKNGGTPSTIASKQFGDAALAVDDAGVYWSTCGKENGVYRLSKTGGTPTLIADTSCAWSIAVDATNVYWISDAIKKADKRGGAAQTIVASKGSALSIDGASIYWTRTEATSRTTFASCADNRSALMKASKDGGAATPLAQISGSEPDRLAIDDTSIYWANECSNGIMRVAKTGGNPSAVVQDQTVKNVGVDETSVYWVTEYEGTIKKKAK